MKFFAVVFASILAAPAFAAGTAPFDIDPEKLLELFLAAASEQFPDIPQQDLMLDHGVSVVCWSTRPNEQVLARDVDFSPCVAGVNFRLGSDSSISRYRDRDGNCKVRSAGRGLSANLDADGNIKVTARVRIDTEEFDCEDGTDPPPDTSSFDLEATRYTVDPKKTLEIALAAVSQTYPDIRAEDLYLSSLIHLMCNSVQAGESVPGLHGKLEPCVAKVGFGIKSQTTEYRYVDSDGTCKIMAGVHNVKVKVAQDGGVGVSDRRGFYGTDEQEVECSEAFYESVK